MTTFICMDGFGGSPEKTFDFLKKELRQDNHKIVLVDVTGSKNWTHRDRVDAVLQAIDDCSDSVIILVGQSAGGSSVQIAAAESSKKISGVIALPPALPRGYFFFTLALLKMMLKWRNLWRVMLGQPLMPTREEYSSLMSPFSKESGPELLDSIQPISGKESRELAFYPPKKAKIICPTLYIIGTEDRWLSVRSLQKFVTAQKKQFPDLVSIFEVENSGHLPLFSERKKEVIKVIKDWISHL